MFEGPGEKYAYDGMVVMGWFLFVNEDDSLGTQCWYDIGSR